MQGLEREWGDEVGANLRRWICATVIPTQRETEADTKVVLVWAIWVMTVSLELFEVVLVIETTGNTVCSLSHSLIVHMAFNRHRVQS